MEPRIMYGRVAPGAMIAMQALEQYVANSELEPALLDLIRTRASQINGCAYHHRRTGRATPGSRSAITWNACCGSFGAGFAMGCGVPRIYVRRKN